MKNLYKIFLLLFAGSAALAMDDKVGDINPASRAPENLNIFKEVDEKEWRAAVVVLPPVISQQGDLDRTVGMPENNTIPFGPTMKGQVDHINSIK
ncbi:hypothetical protein KAZ82_01765, partial [Candidatus Babeliales bacterium]|nr:hypothetical protein [Candidatus Babeliales bacterium]